MLFWSLVVGQPGFTTWMPSLLVHIVGRTWILSFELILRCSRSRSYISDAHHGKPFIPFIPFHSYHSYHGPVAGQGKHGRGMCRFKLFLGVLCLTGKKNTTHTLVWCVNNTQYASMASSMHGTYQSKMILRGGENNKYTVLNGVDHRHLLLV